MSKNTIDNGAKNVISFLTVARASANRLLDAQLGIVASWVDGQPLYTTSFGGANWHWQADFPAATATDNETTCRPTSWVAGGLNGAAVRSLEGNQVALTQAAWKIDRTVADNEGAGSNADPLNNDVEIQRRWGMGKRARLIQATTITYAQSPTTQTALLFEIVLGGGLKFVGTPTVTKAGTVLTAVQTQVRTAGAELGWAITAVGLGAADVSKIVVITASGTAANVGAYALIVKDETGGKVRVSPFGTFVELTGLFTLITPQVGDTIEIRDMTATTLIGNIEGYGVYSGAQTASSTKVVFDSIHLASAVGSNQISSMRACGITFMYARATFASVSLAGPTFNGVNGHFWRGGGGIAGAVIAIRGAGGATFSQIGAIGAFIALNSGTTLTLSSDCYLQNTNVTSAAGGLLFTQGCAFFDRASASGNLIVGPGTIVRQTGAIPDWGTNNAGFGLFVQSFGCYTYVTKPTINSGLGAGRESSIGGVDTQYAAYPATGAVNLTNFAAAVLTA